MRSASQRMSVFDRMGRLPQPHQGRVLTLYLILDRLRSYQTGPYKWGMLFTFLGVGVVYLLMRGKLIPFDNPYLMGVIMVAAVIIAYFIGVLILGGVFAILRGRKLLELRQFFAADFDGFRELDSLSSIDPALVRRTQQYIPDREGPET